MPIDPTPTPSEPAFIYKIFSPADWATFQCDGLTHGSVLDQTDGFIHFSTIGQLQGTLDRHYATAAQIVLAEIDRTALNGSELCWESSRGGALFPHLYGSLPRSALRRHWILRPGSDGRYDVSAIG
ncbi:DUF952 domain-containing protein [uncultured Algimonas sp.]|uniref:DUF952 domain-containing protein n=1 Tax=uncultured Algimonas sp. TaxID=1547920 RepID=UPI0034501A5E